MPKLDNAVKKISEFNQARGWNPTAQDLAKSVVIEAAELLELFQWDSSDESLKTHSQPKDVQKVGSEIADVLWYLATLCRTMNIDLAEALISKSKHNEEKYPAEKFKGKHNEEFYLQQKAKYRQDRNK
jgi:NTP pyrophosphatase (non-canonical NTP hydrolase)